MKFIGNAMIVYDIEAKTEEDAAYLLKEYCNRQEVISSRGTIKRRKELDAAEIELIK